MICFILSREHETSLKALQEDPDAPKVTSLSYSDALKTHSLPAGTYIFTCLSTLSPRRRVAGLRKPDASSSTTLLA